MTTTEVYTEHGKAIITKFLRSHPSDGERRAFMLGMEAAAPVIPDTDQVIAFHRRNKKRKAAAARSRAESLFIPVKSKRPRRGSIQRSGMEGQ